MTDPAEPSSALPPGVDRDGEVSFPGLGTASWITDVGHLRGRNEDRLLVKSVYGGTFVLLLVADGAGGHDAGDKAAEAVVETFNEELPAEGSPPDGEPGRWILDVILAAHKRVRALAHGQSRPPASTVVGMLIERDTLCGWRFHVGDSRLYSRSVDEMVAQWTRDHNITNGLIDRGLPVTQALKIADGGRLTQVLGGASDPEAEVLGPLALVPGQVFLLCSDGVYGHNGDREVLLPVMNPALGTVSQRLKELKVAVLDGEAPDNLTAVLWQVPQEAIATRERETVTNSMRAVTAADIERLAQEEEKKAAEQAKPTPPTPRPAPSRPAADGRGSLLLVIGLLVVLAVLYALFVRDLEGDPDQPLQPETPAEPTAAAETLLNWPADADAEVDLRRLVSSFDKGWWSALPPSSQQATVDLLATLDGVRGVPGMTLAWSDSAGAPPTEALFPDWPAAGPEADALARAAWDARTVVLRDHPELAAQPGVAELLADAGCSQVETRWPRGATTDPGDARQLGGWIAACLPRDLAERSVEVRLGGWPDRGWTLEELNLARYLASKPDGGPQLLQIEAAEGPRMVELGLLAAALSQASLAGVRTELRVVLSPTDVPTQTTAQEGEMLAKVRALEMASLLRSASGGASVTPAGVVAQDLAVPGEGTDEGGASAIADLNRRVEVILRTAPPLAAVPEGAEDELPGEAAPSEPDVELPGEAETTPAPAETTPAPAETTPAPAETTPAPAETAPAPVETTPAPVEEEEEEEEGTELLAPTRTEATEASREVIRVTVPRRTEAAELSGEPVPSDESTSAEDEELPGEPVSGEPVEAQSAPQPSGGGENP